MTRPTTQGRTRLEAKTPDFFASVCFAWSPILTGVTGFLPSLSLWRNTWQGRQLVTPLPVSYEPQPPSKRKPSQPDWALAEGHWLLPEMSHFLLGGLNTIKEVFLWTAYHTNIAYTQDVCASSWIKCLKRVFEPRISVYGIAGVLKLVGRNNLTHFLLPNHWMLQFSNHRVHKA